MVGNNFHFNAECARRFSWFQCHVRHILSLDLPTRIFHSDGCFVGPSINPKRPEIYEKTNETHFTNRIISHTIIDVFATLHEYRITNRGYFTSLPFLLHCAYYCAL